MSQAKRQPTVLITDAGRGSAVALIRGLGRKGWRVIAADAQLDSPGFYSRYTAETAVYPSPKTEPDAFIETLYNLVCHHHVDLLIPVTDEIIHPLSGVRPRFEAICQLAMAEPEALSLVINKEKTFALADRVGVPLPKTCLVQTVAEAEAAAESFGWPIVLKPKSSRQYDKAEGEIHNWSVSYAHDLSSLRQQMQQYEGRCDVLMQAYCAGSGQGIEMLAFEGRPLAIFQHKRLAELPITGGASAWRESVPLDPELVDYATRLVQGLNWTGLIMVEFKVGQQKQLMEINGRVWGSLPLATLSGMDFPGMLGDVMLHGPPPPDTPPNTSYTVGLQAFNLSLLLIWIPKVLLGKRKQPALPAPSRTEAFAPLLNMVRPKRRFDILSRDDPAPGKAELRHLFHKFSGKLVKRGRP